MIASVLAQTYPAIELVIVNDGSTDATDRVVSSYLPNLRIRYIVQENRGISQARHCAIQHSRGQYIAFLDADDIAQPERIREQVSFLEAHPDYGVVYCRFQSFFHQRPDRLYSYRRRFFSGDVFRPLLKHAFINPSTVVMRRSVYDEVGGFDSHVREGEDWDLWRRLAYRGVHFFFLDAVLVHTRLHGDSLSGFHNQVRMKRTNLRSFHRLFAQMSEAERNEYRADAVLGDLRMKLAIAHLLFGRKRHFRFWLRHSRWLYRSYLWPFAFLPASFSSFVIRTSWALKQRSLFRE